MKPRVVSLVPSWTETLVEAGVSIVGRTRFCVHPREKIREIPAVGGTKDLDLEKIVRLNPDLVVLDREENTLEMAESLRSVGLRLHISHVKSAHEMPGELSDLAVSLDNCPELVALSQRYTDVLGKGPRVCSVERLPGVLEWLKTPSKFTKTSEIEKVAYLIWKEPWMSASSETFIGSMLQQLGFRPHAIWPTSAESGANRYPSFDLETLPSESLVLLSSEPYPFHKVRPDLNASAVALVDGESFSWFGIRSLRFLEKL